MNLLTHTPSRFIPSSILIFALTLSGCGGGGDSSKTPTSSSTPPASSVAAVVSSTPTSIAASSTPASVAASSTPASVAVSSSLSSTSSDVPILSSSSSSIMVSSSSVASSAVALTGLFIDSAVAGIHYQATPGGFSGKTSSNGEYEYAAGDTVVFSIGDLKFPAVTAKSVVTPLDIANSNDPENRIALNIAALLQSLDTDGGPDNGISIDYETAAAGAQALNFDQTYEAFAALPAVTSLVADSGSSVTTLVSKSSALTHLQISLAKINTAPLIGTWSLQSNDFRYLLFILDSSRYVALTYEGGATFDHGTYSWNKTTGVVTVDSIEIAGTTLTTLPFATGNTLAINGDVITLNGLHGKHDLAKLISTTNPLIGGWGSVDGNDVVVFAYTDTHYFHGQNGTANENGKPGAEYGTYSNSSVGFTVKTLADTNLQWGSSHPCNIVDTHISQAANDYSCMGSGDKDSLTVSGDILDAYSSANVIANENNDPPRNNEPAHYYFNRVIKNDFEVLGLPHPLLGSWTSDDGKDVFIFSDHKTFTHIKFATDDPNCKAGIVNAAYTWDPKTFDFNLTIFTDTTGADLDDEGCAADGDNNLLTLNGNKLELTAGANKYTFTKSTSSTGLIGIWSLKMAGHYTVLTFTETAYFLSDYDSSGTDDAPIYGSESGTYTYSTGTAKFTVLVDNNGTRGFSDDSDSSTPWPIKFSTDSDSFTIGDGFAFKRLK